MRTAYVLADVRSYCGLLLLLLCKVVAYWFCLLLSRRLHELVHVMSGGFINTATLPYLR